MSTGAKLAKIESAPGSDSVPTVKMHGEVTVSPLTREEREIAIKAVDDLYLSGCVKIPRIAGKQVAGFACAERDRLWLITFDDGTYLSICASVDHEGDASIERCDLDVLAFDRATLVEMGFLSNEQWDEVRALRNKSRERADRALYEELKRRFEP